MKLPLFKFFALTLTVFSLTMLLSWSLEHQQLAANIRLMCSVINPKLQTGALRESMDYLLSSLGSNYPDSLARVTFTGDGHSQVFGDLQKASHSFSCLIHGLPNAHVKIDLQQNNSGMWLTLLLLSALASFGLLRAIDEIKLRTESVFLKYFESEIARIFDLDKSNASKPNPLFFKAEKSPHVQKLKLLIENLKKTVDFQSEQLAQNSARAALGDLVTHVAHDMRSPLSVISLLSKDHSPVNKDASDLMKKAVARLNAICEDVLRTRQNLFHNKSTSVMSVIEQSLALCKAANPNLSLRLISHQEDIPSSLEDLGRFLDILISNARDAINPEQNSGSIQIEFSYTPTTVRISVMDSGSGFPDLLLEGGPRRGLTTKPKGYGLGLAFIQNRLDKIGGKLNIVNTEAHQACASIEYPRELTSCTTNAPLAPCIQN